MRLGHAVTALPARLFGRDLDAECLTDLNVQRPVIAHAPLAARLNRSGQLLTHLVEVFARRAPKAVLRDKVVTPDIPRANREEVPLSNPVG